MLTISRMSGVRLRIVMPWFCTGVGNSGIASVTRFCTITSAVFRSVLTSNVTEQRVGAVVARLRRHVKHARNAVDLLLDRRGDRVRNGLSIRAGIADRHLHRGRA